jgi:acid phosphatase type 7
VAARGSREAAAALLARLHAPPAVHVRHRDFDNQQFQDQLRPLWQAFYDAGGDVVLVHSDFYERYAPQTPTEQVAPARRIRQFIVGTGGRNTYGFGTIEPTSELHIGRIFGVIRLTLHPGSYDWSFVTIPGDAVADSGSQHCA